MNQEYWVLQNGMRMPKLGLGTWKADRNVTKQAVYDSIKMGYRHIDCAFYYENENEVGDAVKQVIAEKICKREDLWITSKLWNTYHKAEHVYPAFEKTYKDLNIGCLDLYLMHFPMAFPYYPVDKPILGSSQENSEYKFKIEMIPITETWAEMEKLVEKKLVKNIGVSNFTIQLLHDLLCYAKIKPVVNQVELHPYLTQSNLIKYCQLHNILVTAYSPLGGVSYSSSEGVPMKEPIVIEIAAKHKKSPAQVVLRWSIQRSSNLSVLVKSTNKDRQVENLDIFNFALTDDEVKRISSLNANKRFFDPAVFLKNSWGVDHNIFE